MVYVVEELAKEFHNVWIKEAIKQGRDDATVVPYEELPENVKDYDRELARYVLKHFIRQPRGLDLNKVVEINETLKQKLTQEKKIYLAALDKIGRKETYIQKLHGDINQMKEEIAMLTMSIRDKVLKYGPVRKYDPKRFEGATDAIIEYFCEKAETGHPIVEINEAVVDLVRQYPRWRHETFRRTIQSLGQPENPDRKPLRVQEGYYQIRINEDQGEITTLA